MTDDQGYGDLSCTGNPWLQTPNIDAFAKNSVDLTNFHVSPLCSPTRASLLSGCHCRRVAVRGTNSDENLMAPNVPTIAEVMSKNGYATGIFGKWHLGDNYPFRPIDRGFQEAVVHSDGAVTTVPDHWGNSYFDDVYKHNGVKKKYEGYCTDVWFREAYRFIEESGDQPFFCYLATNAPHGPYLVAENYAAPYRNDPDILNPEFYGMIANIDENFGRFLQLLDKHHLSKNTILIFMTDNGTGGNAGVQFREGSDLEIAKGYNAGMRGCKGSPYEGGHRVPCYVRWPDGELAHGKAFGSLTAHVDIFPTILDCCDITPPLGWRCDGRSFFSLLRGEDSTFQTRRLIESFQRTVITERFRLVRQKELYDLSLDPGQRTDVAAANPGVVTQLRTALEEYGDCEDSKKYRVKVGNDCENPLMLCGEQWDDTNFWWQYMVGEAVIQNGSWFVDVDRDGEYRFSLRRWPREVDAPINSGLSESDFCYGMNRQNNKTLEVVSAHINLNGDEFEIKVGSQMQEACLRVRLNSGPLNITTTFKERDGQERGAYYVYAERL